MAVITQTVASNLDDLSPTQEKNPPYNFLKLDTARYMQQQAAIPDAGGSNISESNLTSAQIESTTGGFSAVQTRLAMAFGWAERSGDRLAAAETRVGNHAGGFLTMPARAESRVEQIIGSLAPEEQATARALETQTKIGSFNAVPQSAWTKPVTPKPFG